MSAPSFTRQGHCLGCGHHCCSTVVIPLTKRMAADYLAHRPVWAEPSPDPDYQHWLSLHGVDGARLWLLPAFTRYAVAGDPAVGRVPTATIPLRCHALNDDGSCALYDTPERPQMCADWPWEPIDLQVGLTPAGRRACGYSFQKENVNHGS